MWSPIALHTPHACGHLHELSRAQSRAATTTTAPSLHIPLDVSYQSSQQERGARMINHHRIEPSLGTAPTDSQKLERLPASVRGEWPSLLTGADHRNRTGSIDEPRSPASRDRITARLVYRQAFSLDSNVALERTCSNLGNNPPSTLEEVREEEEMTKSINQEHLAEEEGGAIHKERWRGDEKELQKKRRKDDGYGCFESILPGVGDRPEHTFIRSELAEEDDDDVGRAGRPRHHNTAAPVLRSRSDQFFYGSQESGRSTVSAAAAGPWFAGSVPGTSPRELTVRPEIAKDEEQQRCSEDRRSRCREYERSEKRFEPSRLSDLPLLTPPGLESGNRPGSGPDSPMFRSCYSPRRRSSLSVRFEEGEPEQIFTWSREAYDRSGPAPLIKLNLRELIELKQIKLECSLPFNLQSTAPYRSRNF